MMNGTESNAIHRMDEIRLPDDVIFRALLFLNNPLPPKIFFGLPNTNNVESTDADTEMPAAGSVEAALQDSNTIVLPDLIAVRASNSHKLRRMAEALLYQPIRDSILSTATTNRQRSETRASARVLLKLTRGQEASNRMKIQVNLVHRNNLVHAESQAAWVNFSLATWEARFADTLGRCGEPGIRRSQLMQQGFFRHHFEPPRNMPYLSLETEYHQATSNSTLSSNTTTMTSDDRRHILQHLTALSEWRSERPIAGEERQVTELRQTMFRLLLPLFDYENNNDNEQHNNVTIRWATNRFVYRDELSSITNRQYVLAFPLLTNHSNSNPAEAETWVEVQSIGVFEYSHI